ATPNENDQGKTFLGTIDVTTDASGSAAFTFSPSGGVPAGQSLTSTATSAVGTSAFSAPIAGSPPPVTAADLATTITDTPDPVDVGTNITYSITVTDNGPDTAQGVTLTTAVAAGTTFVSFTVPAGWTLTAPAVGGTGAISATTASLA